MRALLALLLIACLALVWSCTTLRSNCTAFIKDEHGIVIFATPFTKADQEQMNATLAKYCKKLYKIETRENGRPTPPQGDLQDSITDKVLAATIMQNLSKPGFTRSAIRVGYFAVPVTEATTNSQEATPTPTSKGTGHNPHRGTNPCSSPIGNTTQIYRIQQKQLIEELTPILEKYSK